MVKSFRVAELQELLGFANRSKTGRKHQLMGRALEMLKCEPGPKVRTKIRELYGNRFPRRMYQPPYVPRQSFSSNGYSSIGESSRNVSVLSPHRPNQSSPSSSLPVHPIVKLRPLPFYDLIDVLVRPYSLGRSFQSATNHMMMLLSALFVFRNQVLHFTVRHSALVHLHCYV